MPRHRTKLNPRQERFVVEYLKDRNGTQAAIRAGYAASSAAVHAHRLLKKDTVLDKLHALRNSALQRIGVTAEKTLRELGAIAFFDPRHLFDDKGNMLPLHKMPKDARSALSGFNIRESVEGGHRVRTLGNEARGGQTGRAEYLGRAPRTDPQVTQRNLARAHLMFAAGMFPHSSSLSHSA